MAYGKNHIEIAIDTAICRLNPTSNEPVTLYGDAQLDFSTTPKGRVILTMAAAYENHFGVANTVIRLRNPRCHTLDSLISQIRMAQGYFRSRNVQPFPPEEDGD